MVWDSVEDLFFLLRRTRSRDACCFEACPPFAITHDMHSRRANALHGQINAQISMFIRAPNFFQSAHRVEGTEEEGGVQRAPANQKSCDCKVRHRPVDQLSLVPFVCCRACEEKQLKNSLQDM